MSTQSSLLKPPPRKQQQKKNSTPSNDVNNKTLSLTTTHPLYGNSKSRICSKCHKHPTSVKGGCLVRVHHLSSSAWARGRYSNLATHPSNSNDGGATLLRVCEECVIGYTLPAYRSAFHQYEMGTIHSYDENSMRHQFEFADGSFEWFHVDEDPYLRYSQWTEECRRQRYYQHHHVPPSSDPNNPLFGTTVGLGKNVAEDPTQNFGYDSKTGVGIGLSTEDLTSPIEPLKEGNIHAMNPLTSAANSNNDPPFNSPPTLPFDPSLGLPSFSFDYDHDDGVSLSGLQFSFGLQVRLQCL